MNCFSHYSLLSPNTSTLSMEMSSVARDRRVKERWQVKRVVKVRKNVELSAKIVHCVKTVTIWITTTVKCVTRCLRPT